MKRLAMLVLVLVVAGCAGQSLRKQIAAGDEVVYQFLQRTARLCLGASPVLSKPECQDRVDLGRRAQTALDAATVAVAGCEPALPCEGGQRAVQAAEAVLLEVETYVFRGN